MARRNDNNSDFFRIPACNFERLDARIAQLARRQAKLAARGPLSDHTPIELIHVATDIEPGKCAECKNDASGCAEYNAVRARARANGQHSFAPTADRVYFIVTITGAAAKLDGYEFVATLQHEDAGTIVRTVPTADVAEGELARFRAVKPHCEHCNVARFRKDTFVVRGTDGALLQVGRNCLGKYLGGASPKAVAALAELLISATGAMTDEEYGGFGGGELTAGMNQFLVFVATSIRLSGWVSRGKARDDDRAVATADEAWMNLFPGFDRKAQAAAAKFAAQITDDDRDLVVAALARAERELFNADNLGDYESNLSIACQAELVKPRTNGIVASLISWHQRKEGREIERKAEAKRVANSTHQGTVGKRIDNVVLTVTRIFDTENEFGVSHGHKFLDTDGNVYSWWTGSQRLDVGSTYHVRGTVKKHSEYKSIKETQLTRCKVAKPELLKAEVVEAVRGDKMVGRGSCSCIDECLSDDELFDAMNEAGAFTGKEAVKAARKAHRAYRAQAKEIQATAF